MARMYHIITTFSQSLWIVYHGDHYSDSIRTSD